MRHGLIPVFLTLLFHGQAAPGRWGMEANSGNDAGVFVLDRRTGRATYFDARFRPSGAIHFQRGRLREEAPGTYSLSVNSGALGGVFLTDTRSGLTKYFKTGGKQVGPNFRFGEDGEPKTGPPGSFAIAANSGDTGGVYILDTRTGVARLYGFDGNRIGGDVRFQGESARVREVGRYAMSPNAGAAEGLFVLDTGTGLCRFFHPRNGGKQWGRDIRFGSDEGSVGRYALSANSGEAGGVFLLDTKRGICRYFNVRGEKVGKDMAFPGAAGDQVGCYALSANSGEAGGVFILDTIRGIARFFHVRDGKPFGGEIRFTGEAIIHKRPGRFGLSANSGSWGGVFLQDTESGITRYFHVNGEQVGRDINN